MTKAARQTREERERAMKLASVNQLLVDLLKLDKAVFWCPVVIETAGLLRKAIEAAGCELTRKARELESPPGANATCESVACPRRGMGRVG